MDKRKELKLELERVYSEDDFKSSHSDLLHNQNKILHRIVNLISDIYNISYSEALNQVKKWDESSLFDIYKDCHK